MHHRNRLLLMTGLLVFAVCGFRPAMAARPILGLAQRQETGPRGTQKSAKDG